jgi:hypothetical protein
VRGGTISACRQRSRLCGLGRHVNMALQQAVNSSLGASGGAALARFSEDQSELGILTMMRGWKAAAWRTNLSARELFLPKGCEWRRQEQVDSQQHSQGATVKGHSVASAQHGSRPTGDEAQPACPSHCQAIPPGRTQSPGSNRRPRVLQQPPSQVRKPATQPNATLIAFPQSFLSLAC